MLSRKKKTKESSSYVTITKIVIGLCFITILYAIPRLSITVSLNQPEQLEFDETAASPPVQPLQRTSLWVAQRTAQPAAVPVATSPRTANQVKKTVFNDFEAGPRFIFVAGIEGTGHHSFSILLKECKAQGMCNKSSHLTPFIWHDCHTPTNIIATQGAKVGDPNPVQERFRQALRETISDPKSKGKVFFLNTMNENEQFKPGQISYPNCLRQEIFPDVELLARILNEEGLDFRAIALHRPSHAVIKSTAVRRHFRPIHEQEKLLTFGSAMLFSQLSNIDPKFYRVVEYHELNQPSVWEEKLAPFIFGTSTDRLPFELKLSADMREKAEVEKRISRANDEGQFFTEAVHWDASERHAKYNDLLLALV